MDYNSYGGGGGGGQTYSTSYGAAGDSANGGGFVGGGEHATSSQAGGGGGGRNSTRETCRPVTVAQILGGSQAHADAPFKIDGEPISHLTLVGQVRSVQSQTTNTTYKVDDGTGIIEVKQWINAVGGGGDDDDYDGNDMDVDGDGVSKKKKEIKEDDYIRVWGMPREYGGKRQVNSSMLRPISDYDEINYHLLEATSVHLYFTRGPPQQQKPKQEQGGAQQGQSAAGSTSVPPSISAEGRKVLQCLRGADNNEGLNLHVIASNTGMNVNDVYKAVEELVQGGLIFTTLDDETYAILGT